MRNRVNGVLGLKISSWCWFPTQAPVPKEELQMSFLSGERFALNIWRPSRWYEHAWCEWEVMRLLYNKILFIFNWGNTNYAMHSHTVHKMDGFHHDALWQTKMSYRNPSFSIRHHTHTHTHDIYIYIYTYMYIYIQIYFLHAYIDINTCIYYLIYLYTYVYIMYYTTTGFPNLLGTQMQQQFSDADYLEVRGAPCGHKGCETCGPQTWISSFPLKHVGKTIRG